MAINFPTSLDTITNPTSGDGLDSPSHAGQHTDANDILEALEAKVGVDSSAVTDSLDYKVAQNTAKVKATGAELDTATNDVKFATAKALADSKYVKRDETATLTNKTLTSPVISSISNTGTITLPTSTDTLVGKATTDTLTNKRITSRIKTFTSDATPDIDSDDYDAVTITALAAAITDVNVTGTPTNFQHLMFRIKDNGTEREIAWGSDFEASGVALPDTTVAGKTLLVGFIYDSVDSKWACEATSSRA